MAEYLNNNIKHLRTSNGISQQSLADKIGIDRSTISRIENNEIETTIDNAIKIADTFNISLSDLVNRDLRIEKDDYTKNNEKTKTLNILYDKLKDLPEDKQKIILNVTEAVIKDIDEQLDNK